MQVASAPREPRDNEYLHDAKDYLGEKGWLNLAFQPGARKEDTDRYVSRHFQSFIQRPRYVERYAWAVPNEKALQTVAKYGPFIEIGAGTGYWAYLLRRRGVQIRAYDLYPPHREANHYHPDQKVWTTVYRGGPEKASLYPKRSLLLCWPPYASPMAYDTLQAYDGPTVIYVGEWEGCTADDSFHEALETEWTRVETVNLPTWPGIRDFLSVWKRKELDSCPPLAIVSPSAVTKASEPTATAANKPKSSGRRSRR